jgi:uncharacterized repeat protein (TIGR03803 family)
MRAKGLGVVLLGGLTIVSTGSLHCANASTESVLYALQGGSDGQEPYADVVFDGSGNAYGLTLYGGSKGDGTVFKLSANGTESVLYAFQGSPNDGSAPQAGLDARDSVGNFYGITSTGGQYGNGGTIFEISARRGPARPIYSFHGSDDPFYPQGSLLRDSAGNLYGTTSGGGGGVNCQFGCGAVFELTTDGTFKTLYAFQGGSNDGMEPVAGLVMDSAHNLIGTTTYGGTPGCVNDWGCGIVYSIAPNGTETVLYKFQGGTDGSNSNAAVMINGDGNFVGTTQYGGGSSKCNMGCGTVFIVSPGGAESVLYRFRGGVNDGAAPIARLVQNKNGVYFGTTQYGGHVCGTMRCGTVFGLLPTGRAKVLHFFGGGSDGANPAGALAIRAGKLFGTTAFGGGAGCGGSGCGTVFSVVP